MRRQVLQAMLMGMAIAALDGVETGINTTYKLNRLRVPGSKTGPGTKGRSSADNFMDIQSWSHHPDETSPSLR